MNAFAEFVKERLAVLKEPQKAVVGRFHTECGDIALATAETKLSKLVNGDEEGLRFFEVPKRLTALAVALKVEAAVLTEKLRVTREVVHLILDGRLPARVAEFLKRQQSPAHFVVIEPSGDCVALRDEARKHALAWVVLGDTRDVEFYKGAEVQWSGVTEVPRGWQLDRLPDLVQVPPPPPPRLFGEDGSPMAPCEPLVARLSEDRNDLRSLAERVKGQQRISQTPTFSLGEMVRAENAFPGLFGYAVHDSLTGAGELTEAQISSGNFLWTTSGPGPGAEGKVFGDRGHRLAAWFEPVHPLHKPRAIAELESAKQGNPYSALARAKEGLTFDGVSIASEVRRWATAEIARLEADIAKADEQVAEVRNDLEQQGRSQWAELRKRNLRALRKHVWIAHLMAACDHAPIVVFQSDDRVLLDAVFNLGAGRLVSVVAIRLKGEVSSQLSHYEDPGGRSTFHVEQRFELDGGDVHLWFRQVPYAEMLEGSAIPARARRWAAAAEDDLD